MRSLYNFGYIFLILVLTAGCVGTKKAEMFKDDEYRKGNYDGAIKRLSALNDKKKGKNKNIKALLFRAKIAKYYKHLSKARKFRDSGKKEEALKEYKFALDVFPENNTLLKEVNNYIKGVDLVAQRRGIKSSDVKLPCKLIVENGKKIDLNLRSVPMTSIFKSVGKFYKVNFIFDKDFKDFVYTIEIDDIDFDTILKQLCLVSNCKFRIIGEKSVLIYQDSAFKKRYFALKGVKVFYLSNIVAKEASKLVLALFRDQQIILQEDANLNCLIVKGTSDTLKEIELFINKIDKQKSEVLLDVEILEVNRKLINKLGSELGTNPINIAAGTLADDGKSVHPIFNLNKLKDTTFFATLPAVALNFLGQDENNTLVAKPNLRGVDGEDIKFMVGDEVPIPSTKFGSVGAGGVNTIPQTSYDYKNVGIEIKITPHIHGNNEVTLKIKLTMNFITGYNKENFPILGKRELENVIRLSEGETNLIGGFIKDEDREAIKGTTGLMKIPILGKLFGGNDDESLQTDILFAITPRIIRRSELKGEDLIPVWAGDDNSGNSSVSSDKNRRSRKIVNPPLRVKDSVMLIAPSHSVPAGQVINFPIVMNSNKRITSLSISGSVTNGEIIDMSVEGDEKKMVKNFSTSSFTLGASWDSGTVSRRRLGVLKVKFKGKGDATVSIDSISAFSEKGKGISLKTEVAEINVR